MNEEFEAAVRQICDEKGISPEQVYQTIEAAIASAYRKDYGKPGQKIEVEFNPQKGKMRIFQVLEVVEECQDPDREITLEEAKKFKKKPKVGDIIKIEKESPESYGRIAAQTAKQVIIQKIRESEREVLYNEFKGKVGELLTGVVQQIEGKNIIINLGKTNGILFPNEQVPEEHYYIGQRLKVYVVSVEETTKNPQILLSRAHPEMIRRLFELEVPEINSQSVEIKAIAREAGKRSKVAVFSNQEGVDPIGSCVGQRGTRIQTILAELGEEKIDIILWDENPEKYIENALSPAKIKSIKLNKKNKTAEVLVSEDQLSLAIGKEGQNVRLASKLTGWEIKVEKEEKKELKKKESSKAETQTETKAEAKEKENSDEKTLEKENSDEEVTKQNGSGQENSQKESLAKENSDQGKKVAGSEKTQK